MSCMSLLEDNWTKLRRFIKEELKIQLKTEPTDSSSLECHICFKRLSTKPSLARHLAKHDTESSNKENTARLTLPKAGPSVPVRDYDVSFVCLLCGRAFANVEQCEAHLWRSDSHQEPATRTANGDTAVVHVRCAAARDTEEPPLMRMDAVVLRSIFQCEFCDYVFARKEDVLKHEATHDPKLGYICTSCEINSPSSREVLQHWAVACPFTRNPPAMAGSSSSVKEKDGVGVPHCGIPPDMERIFLATEFVCNVCFETFASLEILYDHRHKENHYFPRYSHLEGVLLMGCEVCGEMFSSCIKYCEHYDEQHTKKLKAAALAKNRQYLCDVCGKTYTQSSHLWQHLRFHKGVKPFKCTVEGCERRFTIRPDLNDHVRKFHTHERPYQCLVCGKRFLTGSVFYQHRLIHRGERRYECETCHKKFFRADALKNHNRIHTGEKPFKCLACTKTFRQRGDLMKHMETRHMKAAAVGAL